MVILFERLWLWLLLLLVLCSNRSNVALGAAGGYKDNPLAIAADEQQHDDDDFAFNSRRSAVVCRNGCVASSQPLASSIGVDLLRQGANAAEAAIAVAAALAVTEPRSTGLGGDMFCLYYDANTRQVSCISASGKSPAGLSLELIQQKCPNDDDDDGTSIDASKFASSALSVTVPGAARGWEDLLQRHGSGKFTMQQLLEPAAQMAEHGFPVSPITSNHWKVAMPQLTKWFDNPEASTIPMTVDGQNAPEPGDIFVNQDLARVLRELGTHGATHFYEGPTGKAMAASVQRHGGCLTVQDLRSHVKSEFLDPISTEYRGCRLWQCPPPGQGIAGLIALAGLKHLEDSAIIPKLDKSSSKTADFYHVLIEMMRLGFADTRAHVADPTSMKTTAAALLDPKRIADRAQQLFDLDKAAILGAPDASSCTINFQIVDSEGNSISFVQSNYWGFGSGIVPDGCGFCLQNRGYGFTLSPKDHPNIAGPSKRPYHTIIAGMMTHADTNELYASITTVGQNMQPQGHLQLAVGMLAAGYDPQTAIDLPRFCIADGTQSGVVFVESGFDPQVMEELQRRGHKVHGPIGGHARKVFGRANIIKRDRTTGVLWAGCDGRADGCAVGY